MCQLFKHLLLHRLVRCVACFMKWWMGYCFLIAVEILLFCFPSHVLQQSLRCSTRQFIQFKPTLIFCIYSWLIQHIIAVVTENFSRILVDKRSNKYSLKCWIECALDIFTLIASLKNGQNYNWLRALWICSFQWRAPF